MTDHPIFKRDIVSNLFKPMLHERSSSPIRKFGVFQADVENRTLHRKGIPVRLPEQPFRLLALLLEHPGQLVSREKIQQVLWPDGTFVDFDSSLNAAMKKLRAALDDDPDSPRFIETVPKRGYRFIAPVESLGKDTLDSSLSGIGTPAAANHVADKPIAPPTPSLRRKRLWLYPVVPVVLFVVVWQFIYWTFPLPPPQIVSRTRVTTIGRVETFATLVGDGSRVLFSVREGPQTILMQTSVNGGEALPVQSPFKNNAYIFNISPDRANFLVGTYERRGDAELALWIWPIQGGPPRRLDDYFASYASWSPDGRQIGFSSGDRIFVVNADGTDKRELAHLSGAKGPSWSPDGSVLRFGIDSNVSNNHEVWELNPDGSNLHLYQPGDKKIEDLWGAGWAGDGKYFIYWTGEPPHATLWAIREKGSFLRRSSRMPWQLSNGPDDPIVVVKPQVDGHRMLAQAYWPNSKLFAIPHDTRQPQLVSQYANAASAHFSPDGQWVAFSKLTDRSLWRCHPDGSECMQLTSPPIDVLEPRWSPDSQQILFTDNQPGVPHRLYTVPANGSSPPKILGPKDLVAGTADWSPDGKHIVVAMYPSTSLTGGSLYILDVLSGKLDEIPDSKGIYGPAWSHDGRLIAAIDPSSRRLLLFDTLKRQWRSVAEGKYIGYLYWSNRSNNLYYQDLSALEQPIFRIDPASGKHALHVSFSEALRTEAMTCRLNGIGPDDTLYVMEIHGNVDVFTLDLNLP